MKYKLSYAFTNNRLAAVLILLPIQIFKNKNKSLSIGMP